MMDGMSSWPAQFKRRFVSGEQEQEVAVTYLLLAVALHASGLVNQAVPALESYRGWWPVPMLAGAGAILLRRRRLGASVAGQLVCAVVALAVGSIGGYLLLFESVFSIFLLASTRIRQLTTLVIAALLLGSGVLAGVAMDSFQQGLLAVFVAGFVLLTPALWAMNVRNALELARIQRQRAEALHSAAQDRERLLEARHRESMAEERTALAREMHDVLSARFSSIALLSGALADRTAPGSATGDGSGHADLHRPLQTIRTESLSGLEEMTQMVRMLHSRNSTALVTSLDGLPALVASFRDGGSRIDFSCDLGPRRLTDPRLGTAIYRTLNELLVNHAKHAPEQPLRLRVGLHGQDVAIRAGNPVAPDHGSRLHGAGTGLGNIRARAEALGGSMHSTATADGFVVAVRFPLAPPDHPAEPRQIAPAQQGAPQMVPRHTGEA